jgi:hypothetical protein
MDENWSQTADSNYKSYGQEDSCQDGKVSSIDDAQDKGRKPSIKEVA